MMRLNLVAPANQLGYGVAAMGILRGLQQEGHEVALFPIGPSDVPPEWRPMVDKATTAAGQYDIGAPCLRVFHQDQMGEFVGRGLRIGFPFFELDHLKPRERYHLSHLDALIVTSEWAKTVVKDNGLRIATHVVPLGVDREVFHEAVARDRLHPDYTVFVNAGKWEVRKGHDTLLRAFNKAFSPTDKVILKMLTPNPFIGSGNQAWERMYKGSRLGHLVNLQTRRLPTPADVARFLASADCGVFPSKAEGWNLELLECLSLGLHCIATDYAAHAAYVTEDNCRLIEITDLEPAVDNVWFHGEGQWARMGDEQEEQLIHHMREIHRLKQTGQLPARNEGGIETAKKLSWRATARMLAGLMGGGPSSETPSD